MNLARLSPAERRASLKAYRLPPSPTQHQNHNTPPPLHDTPPSPDPSLPSSTQHPLSHPDRGPNAPDSLPEPAPDATRTPPPPDPIELAQVQEMVPEEPGETRKGGVRGWVGRFWRGVGRHLVYHAGPGILASVAYFDPGNWTVDIQAGATYGYGLLFVVLLSGLGAVFLQLLASRLGVVTGLDLAQHTRALLVGKKWTRWGLLYPLYAVSEAAILFTDLAELLGSAIALNLIFPSLPLFAGVLITSLDVIVVLALWGGRGGRWLELGVVLLCAGVLGSFVVLIVRVGPEWGEAFKGFLPSNVIFAPGALYISIGILGATVMPHALYLGSALATQTREPVPISPPALAIPATPLASPAMELSPTQSPLSPPADSPKSPSPSPAPRMSILGRLRRLLIWDGKVDVRRQQGVNNTLGFVRAHMWHAEVDVVGSLVGLALVINAAILILGATAFYYPDQVPDPDADIFSAHALLGSMLGAPAAFLFAFALLCSGQSASLTATMAGQIVSEGFLEWRMSPFLRRLITRLIGLVPATIVAAAFGRSGLDTLLVASQVALSICLPGVIFPLLWVTGGRKGRMIARGAPISGGGEAGSAEQEESGEVKVDFRNAWYVSVVGWLLWVVILLANVYAIVELGIGGGT